MSSLAAKLRSSNASMQSSALLALDSSAHISLSEDILNAVIECLSSESSQVRSDAYLVLEIYQQAFEVSHVEDISQAAFAELSNADSAAPLKEALRYLYSLSDTMLFHVCGTRDSIQNLRIPDSVIDNTALNAHAFTGVSKILLRLWLLLDQGLESFTSIESFSDARRQAEELNDFIIEFFVKYIKQICNFPPNMNDYCSMMCNLLDLYIGYNDRFDVNNCVSSILGLSNTSRLFDVQLDRRKVKASRLAMLIKPIVSTLFSDPFTLISTHRQHFSGSDKMRHMISLVFVIILQEIPESSAAVTSTFDLITKTAGGIFDSTTNEDSKPEVSFHSSSYNLRSLVLEWMEKTLVPSYARCYTRLESADVTRQIISLLYFDAVSSSRKHISEAALFHVLHALPRFDMQSDTVYDSMVVYALLLARHLPWNTLADYVSPILDAITKTSSSIAKLRLLTEFWSIMLAVGDSGSELKPPPIYALPYCIKVGTVYMTDAFFGAYNIVSLSRILVAKLLTPHDASFADMLSCAVLTINTFASAVAREFENTVYHTAAVAFLLLLQSVGTAVLLPDGSACSEQFSSGLAAVANGLSQSRGMSLNLRANYILLTARHVALIESQSPKSVEDVVSKLVDAAMLIIECNQLRSQALSDLGFLKERGALGGANSQEELSTRSAAVSAFVCIQALELIATTVSSQQALRRCWLSVEKLQEVQHLLPHLGLNAINDSIYRTGLFLKGLGFEASAKSVAKVVVSKSDGNTKNSSPSVGPVYQKTKLSPTTQSREDPIVSVFQSSASSVNGTPFDDPFAGLQSAPVSTQLPSDYDSSPAASTPALDVYSVFESLTVLPPAKDSLRGILAPVATEASPRRFDLINAFSSCLDAVVEGSPAAADVNGIVDDVVRAHLSSSHVDKGKPMYPEDYTKWEQLSCCSDIVAVFGAINIHPEESTAEIRVKVFNGAGFKIPTLSLSFSLTSDSRSVTMFPNVSSTSDPIENFVPNAFAKHSFFIELHRLTRVQINLSVIYDELVVPEADYFTLKSTGTDKGLPSNKAVHRSSAKVRCRPLFIPILALLGPYGLGVFSMLDHWKGMRDIPSISADIYFSLCDRLQFNARLVIEPSPSLLYLTQNSDGSLEQAETIMNSLSPQLMGESSSFQRARVSIQKKSKYMKLFAWAFQSLWGDECVIVLTLRRQGGGLSGSIEVRCQSEVVLGAVLVDSDDIIRSLTRGLFLERKSMDPYPNLSSL